MAKEMMIIFVYDTQMLQKEDDDPSSAILYFHPSWVSDQQKTALCGQLMGTVHCIKTVLSVPKIVSLQSGKFYVKEYGRYLLAMGTDRNIADWLLEHRAAIMSSLISFFHQDIEVMSKIYDTSAKLSAKLYQLFETYLKYLFLGGSIFAYIPTIKLPKSASNVFLEAIHILECCQEVNYVLGGSLFYHNKVVATQLSSDLTKRLVLSDPYRIKCPAEGPTSIDFEMPLGVQLLQVYIPSKEYYRLHEEATRNRTIFQYLRNKSIRKVQSKPTTKEPVKSALKRDQSIIFTAVPEEDSDHQTLALKPAESQNRPKFLNLKSKTTDLNQLSESRSKHNPSTPYYQGPQPSVCSTPMTDLNKVIHTKPLSICINPVDEIDNDPIEDSPKNIIKDIKFAPIVKIQSILHDKKKSQSAIDLRENLKSIHPSITTKYYDLDHVDDVKPSRIFKTIADPNYPVFRADGTLVSHPFYEDYITQELELITTTIQEKPDESIIHKDLNFKDFDINLGDFVKSVSAVGSSKLPDDTVPEEAKKSTNKSKDRRKSLCLPLKSLNSDDTQQASPVRRYSSGVQLTPLMSKLSSFTFDDRSSGFCSRDTTPSEHNKLFTPIQSNFNFSFKKLRHKFGNNGQGEGELQKCVLFVCGQQDVVVTLLLQEESCSYNEVITKLWEICTENLSKLEKQLHHCLENQPTGNMQTDSEPYSYLHLDPEWGTIQRGGPWGNAELGTLMYFHRDFKENDHLTELLMRCCDGVIYGNQCGKSEVFYHQSANSNAGLPTPADPMGNVPLKAKRRLERDHSIILL